MLQITETISDGPMRRGLGAEDGPTHQRPIRKKAGLLRLVNSGFLKWNLPIAPHVKGDRVITYKYSAGKITQIDRKTRAYCNSSDDFS